MNKFFMLATIAIAAFAATPVFAGPHGGHGGRGSHTTYVYGHAGRGVRSTANNNNNIVINNNNSNYGGNRGCGWGGGGCRPYYPCTPCPGYIYDRGYYDGRYDSRSGLFDAACITNIVASGVSILSNLSGANRTTVVQPVYQQPVYQQPVYQQQPVYYSGY